MKLTEPLYLGRGRTARNRILFGPHETNLGWDRSVGARHVAYYERRARGGAGIIVIEAASVHVSDWPYERAPLAADSEQGWAAVAHACRPNGTIVVAGIGHSGGQGASAFNQAPMWAPSGIPEVNTREVPKVMETEDIDGVVEAFGDAARVAVASGLDGVEVNAGQHSLIRQFLSGLSNVRADDYGADRERFAREVLASVRTGAGPDALVGLRLSCDELAPWAGITPEAGAEIAARLVEHVDYLVVVRGGIFSAAATRPDGHEQPGFNLELTRAVRAAVDGKVPVFAQGSIVDVDQAEWAIAAGMADGVEMTRAQIADPDLGSKLAAGALAQVRPCILCNQRCMVRDNRNPIVSCVVEPRSGYEYHDGEPEAQAAGGADLLVVGGGPGGLEAARVAALRGRRVVLRERSSKFGGALLAASAAEGRARLWSIAAWLEAECRRLGVQLETDAMVTNADLAAWQGPVVLATGGRDRDLRTEVDFEVADDAVVVSSAELLSMQPGERPAGDVLVWDPIGGPIGVSVAETLVADDSRTVHLASPDFTIGTQLSLSGDLAPANVRLHQRKVVLHKRVLLRRVEAGAAVTEGRFDGVTERVAVAWVVDAGHRLAADPLREPGMHRGHSVSVVGDADAPRTVYEAILEARRAVLALDGAPTAATSGAGAHA